MVLKLRLFPKSSLSLPDHQIRGFPADFGVHFPIISHISLFPNFLFSFLKRKAWSELEAWLLNNSVQILTQPLSGCATWGKSLDLSEPPLFCL